MGDATTPSSYMKNAHKDFSTKGLTMPSDVLKAKLKECTDERSEPSTIRLHRANSWLERSEKEANDSDAQIIFLWISFNAAYARLFGFEITEREQLQQFVENLVASDSEKSLQKVYPANSERLEGLRIRN